MKRLISILIICSIIMLFGINVCAAGAVVSVGTASAASGETLYLPVTISGNTGFANLGIEIGYDSSVLTLKSVTPGNVGTTYTSAQNISANPYNMGWDSTGNISFNGDLAMLEFEVSTNVEAGEYPITVSYYKGRNGDYEDGSDVNYDESFNPINLTYVSGKITVEEEAVVPVTDDLPTVKAAKVSGNKGDTVSVPIMLENNTGFANLGIEIGYDSSALILKSVMPGNVGATYTSAQSVSANPYNMGWDSTSNISFNGDLATLEFEVLTNAEAGEYPITVSFFKGREGNYADGIDVNYDENFAPLNLNYINGYVMVLGTESDEKSISVSDVQVGGMLRFNTSIESGEDVNGMIIASVFDANGKLLQVKVCEAESEIEFSFSNIKGAALIKAFWWNDVLTPLCEHAVIPLE